MLGAIIGDMVGSPFEFANTKNPFFPLFSKSSSFTDDSVCTVAVADAILRGEEDFSQSLRRWCGFYPNPMGGYGASFLAWLRDPAAGPYFSFGNGAAMRVSPCGFARTEEEAIRLALASASCTHNHPEGLIGAMVVSMMVHRIRTCSKTDAMAECEQIMCRFYGVKWEACLPPRGFFDETCQGCVPLAFSLLRKSHDFEDAIRRAVLYGGDSDTLAAIVGALAEARFGIPSGLKEKALSRLPNDMLKVVVEFYKIFGYD